jgi:alpha-D-xyloside xylohydrolase
MPAYFTRPFALARLALAVLGLSGAAFSVRAEPVSVATVTRQPDGVLLQMSRGILRLQVWSANIIRVTYAPGATLPDLHSFSVVASPAPIQWSLTQPAEAVILATPALQARVDRFTGAVSFLDASGRPILRESPDDGKAFAPANLTGGNLAAGNFTSVSQSFLLSLGEGIYGLGQHQSGIWDYVGTTVHLQQKNMEVALPVLISSRGYGLLWDNPAITDVAVGIDDHPNLVTWTSEVGTAVDYYFLYGPALDTVVQDYRWLTGPAPLMPKWFWGLWQSKERYQSADELLAIAQKYRDLAIPVDGLIQDWQYWKLDAWGSNEFDPSRYPDPAAMTKALHDLHFHVLISVWPKFDLGTDNYNKINAAHAFYPQVIPYVFPPGQGQWYDPFNPDGRRLYWQGISDKLFAVGLDGWWLDAPEPELSGKWGEFRNFSTAAGPGAAVFNAYPLLHSTGVYQGQRAQTDQQRVVILTRSAYPGQQRNAAVTWSGDIQGRWNVLAAQIPAGLNFSVSGIPYWNTDIGGFFGAKTITPAYAELFTRWFQFGAFTPMFRVHGTNAPKELWRWDDSTQKILLTYDQLRYRLLPYLYSVSWRITHAGYTLLRPLFMDFPGDINVLPIKDEYLFGPSILVAPVTAANTTTRSVYLPGSASWYDFWTGNSSAAAQIIDTPAPIETLPLFIRAGSILPLGPLVQYAAAPADAIELRVYRGADGSFSLYEDDGTTYAYEKGAYATIPLTWDDTARTLTIGARSGSFPGMLSSRTFRIVFVSPGHGAGLAPITTADQEVTYTGTAVTVPFKK